MKDRIKLAVLVILAILATVLFAHAGTPPVPPALTKPAPKQAVAQEVKSWWTDYQVSTFAVITQPNLVNAPLYGAGIDVGYAINKTVELHLSNLAYERDNWGGSAIDESALIVRADLIKYSKERLIFYVLSSGERDWWHDEWGFGAGAGAELRFNRNLSIGADYRIRAWFSGEREKDGQTRGFLSYRF